MRQPIVEAADSLTHLTFEVIALIMKAAPIGAFGAMAFTIGKYGLKTLLPLGKLLLCVYLTSALFVFLVLGLIARLHGFSLWKFLKYIKEELLIVLGTSSSEAALPRIIVKLERLGCSKSVVGLVVPSGLLVQPGRHGDLSHDRRPFRGPGHQHTPQLDARSSPCCWFSC